jgi:hypothetical protein
MARAGGFGSGFLPLFVETRRDRKKPSSARLRHQTAKAAWLSRGAEPEGFSLLPQPQRNGLFTRRRTINIRLLIVLLEITCGGPIQDV